MSKISFYIFVLFIELIISFVKTFKMATQKKKKLAPLKEWHTIHARMSNEDYELLKETAKTDKRSVTKLAELVLSNWINSIKTPY